jgi:hypothetical protein
LKYEQDEVNAIYQPATIVKSMAEVLMTSFINTKENLKQAALNYATNQAAPTKIKGNKLEMKYYYISEVDALKLNAQLGLKVREPHYNQIIELNLC